MKYSENLAEGLPTKLFEEKKGSSCFLLSVYFVLQQASSNIEQDLSNRWMTQTVCLLRVLFDSGECM